MHIKLLATDSKLSLDHDHRLGGAQPSMHVYNAKCMANVWDNVCNYNHAWRSSLTFQCTGMGMTLYSQGFIQDFELGGDRIVAG